MPAMDAAILLGLALMALATFVEEASTSMGRTGIDKAEEFPLEMGFLNAVAATGVYALIVVWLREPWTLTSADLPLFALRGLLDIAIGVCTVFAVAKADRGTFALLRLLTIPAALAFGILIGIPISPMAAAAAIVIMLALWLLGARHDVKWTGAGWAVTTSVLAGLSVVLFQRQLTQSAAPATMQLWIVALDAVVWGTAARIKDGRWPIAPLRHPLGWLHAGAMGIGAGIEFTAFTLAPGALLIATKRGLAMGWALTSGQRLFHETGMRAKWIAAAGGLAAIILATRAG
jgi:hypothetical protein